MKRDETCGTEDGNCCSHEVRWRRGYDLWQTENDLVDHRIGWLGFSQPLLFAVLVFAEEGGFGLTLGLAFFGLSLSLLVTIGVLAAVVAQSKIHKIEAYGKFAGLGGNKRKMNTSFWGWVPGIFIPVAFLVGWGLIVLAAWSDGKLGAEETDFLQLKLGSFEVRINK